MPKSQWYKDRISTIIQLCILVETLDKTFAEMDMVERDTMLAPIKQRLQARVEQEAIALGVDSKG